MKFQRRIRSCLCNFSDAALRQMETERPMSDTELLAIDGVGKAKLENMAMLLKVIQRFPKAKGTKKKKEATT
jgi:ATP-dependent DNA helicase RecQ